LPSRTEDSDLFSTLPPEELNPLVNPLLAQNMGRWAEVYFTNPPENRDQAVTDLVYQLRAEASSPENSSRASIPAVMMQKSTSPPYAGVFGDLTRENVVRESLLREGLVRCPQCGYENRSDHNFCGACRAELRGPDTTFGENEPREAVQPPFEAGNWFEAAHGENGNGRRTKASEDDDVELFRYASTRRSSRPLVLFLGLIIVVVAAVVFFGYKNGWARFLPSSAPEPTASSEPVAKLPAPTTSHAPSDSPSSTQSNTPAGTPKNNVAASKPAVTPGTAVAEPDGTPDPDTDVSRAPLPRPDTAASAKNEPPAADANPSATPLAGNGGAELSQAKEYLNGASGQERNSAEAASLLWKSVSKQNPEATELLGDLYLKGDGVVKNCDQARILLEAAARKGRKDAGQRLQHLDAFGCQ
jgi:TPR repeat protein